MATPTPPDIFADLPYDQQQQVWVFFDDLLDTVRNAPSDPADTLQDYLTNHYWIEAAPEFRLNTDLGVEVVVTTSDGSDGCVVVFVDTDFAPNGSDDGPGLRVNINDHPTFQAKEYAPWPDTKSPASGATPTTTVGQ